MTMKVLEKGTSFASDVEIGSGVLWLPYKNIHDTVVRAISEETDDAFRELEECARLYKTDFVGFLSTKGRSASDREQLKKAVSEGLYLRGYDVRQNLHPQLVNETLLLSDIFDINEFLALDLLSTAESIKEEYPNWARGLIAVFLYFEGQHLMIQSVIHMITSVPGRQWNKALPQRVSNMFANLLSLMLRDDVIDKLIGAFEKSDVKTRMETLDSNLALGDWRHRVELNRLITSVREGIALIMFAKSAQEELNWKNSLRLIEFLKGYLYKDDDFEMGKSEVFLITSVMNSIANNLLLPDYDQHYAKEVQKYIKDMEDKTVENHGFKCYELLELIRLMYHVMTHRALSETNINSVQGIQADILRDDEDFYFKKDLFAFLKNQIFSKPDIFTDEFVMRRFHDFFSDFISYMPMKVKEMKMRSEDAAKTANLYFNQGIQRPPNLPEDYENLMECLGTFYAQDSYDLSSYYFSGEVSYLPLNKLARGACIDSPVLFVPNATFLRGLARSSPNDVFDLLKQNGHNFSFDHFFDSIMKYLSNYGNNQAGVAGLHGASLFTSDVFQKVVMDPMRLVMIPAEVSGIFAYLDVIIMICTHSERIRNFFTNQKVSWIRICLQAAKQRAITREIRAKMIESAASMICVNVGLEAVNSLWEAFYSSKLVGQENGDLRSELEEFESRQEVFPLTLSMLKLLNALVDCRFKESNVIADTEGWDLNSPMDNGAFEPYLTYVRDHVLLKACFRSYRNKSERWEISRLSIELVSKLLDHVPQLMYQMLCGSPLLKTVLTTLVDCMRAREGLVGELPDVDLCAFACLNLIRRSLHRQSRYLHRRDVGASRHDAVIVGMQELLMKIISETGRPEFMLNVLKYVDTLQPDSHRLAALEILALSLTDRDDIDAHLYAALNSDVQLVSVLKLSLINALYEPETSNNAKKTILQILRVSVVHSMPNIGTLLLGVDKRVDFQNPGVAGYPRTILHALLENAPTLPDAFNTLLTLIRDPRLWNPLLRYLKTNHFFSNFLKQSFPSPQMSLEDTGYLLKCIAVELKTSGQPGQLAHTIIEVEFGKFQEVLNILELDQESLEIPVLEYFDSAQVMEAIKACEYYDSKLKTRTVRLDLLEAMLKDEIAKLERNTILRLRQTIYGEAKEIVEFANQLNTSRSKEAAKIIVFDGWRQCLEILVLTPSTLKLAGVDFVTSILRVLLIKIVDSSTPSEFFCRLGAETVLTLSAVMGTFKREVNSTTLNVVLGFVCKWIADEQSPRVRATLYAAILHIVKMFSDANQAGKASVNSFALILDHLCKDCCQAPEIGKMQAMYLMGEIICLTTARGLGGEDRIGRDLVTFNRSANESKSSLYLSKGPSGFNESMNRSVLGERNGNSYYSHPTNGSPISAARSSADYLPAHSNIMTYMYAKGFLGNLVDVIKAIDDVDLLQLLTSQVMYQHMKSFYVFEAKMSLLTRFAATGQKAVLLLMDVNIVHKLCDMRVFEVRCFQEDMLVPQTPALNETTSLMSLQGIPSRKTIMENLFSNALKLFHVMVDSVPKNVLLVEQIWSFLITHDEPLSNLISRANIEKTEQQVGSSLLVSLLAKIAKKLPAIAFTSKTEIVSKLQDILKRQAIEMDTSNQKVRLIKDAVLFLYNFARNKEVKKREMRSERSGSFRPVLSDKVHFDQLNQNPEGELNIGVLVKVVGDLAHWISGNQFGDKSDEKLRRTVVCTLESGLTLIYLHVERFLQEKSESSQTFKDEFIPAMETKLVKSLTDVSKIISHGDYIEMLLLRLRRLAHNPSN